MVESLKETDSSNPLNQLAFQDTKLHLYTNSEILGFDNFHYNKYIDEDGQRSLLKKREMKTDEKQDEYLFKVEKFHRKAIEVLPQVSDEQKLFQVEREEKK